MREFLILTILNRYSSHAGEIQHCLFNTAFSLNDNTLYSLLSRLRNKKYIEGVYEESDQGQPRIHYHLTDAGKIKLEKMNIHWERSVNLHKYLSRSFPDNQTIV